MCNHRRKKRRFLSIGLCAVLISAMTAWPSPAFAAVEEVDDGPGEGETAAVEGDVAEPTSTTDQSAVSEELAALQSKITNVNQTLESYKQQQKEIEADIQSARTEKEKAEKQRSNVSYQITLTQNEISALAQRVALLGEDISLKQKNIEQKQTEIDSNYELFKERLKAKHMQDNGTLLSLLLGSDSFSEFLTRSEHMARIGQHDREMMDFLTTERMKIEEEKASLESAKKEVESTQMQQESKKKELAVKYTDAQKQVHSAQADEAAFKADLAKNQAEQAKMKAEIDNFYKQIEFIKTPYVGGSMVWPLPGYTTISSNYGSRFGGTDFHTGIDITGSGCHGAPIRAAQDGTVSMVNTAYTNGSGYGIYLIIDHGVKDGQNISTLYAHCSSISVSPGQEVKAGETIAAVGSTGWSTGPHLHFEVRIGTKHVSPGSYIGL